MPNDRDDDAIPMRKAEVTREEVIQALNALAEEHPVADITIRMVHDRLGGRGAVSTISVHRRAWLDEREKGAQTNLPSTEVVSQVQLRAFQDQLGQVLGGLRDRLDAVEKGALIDAARKTAQLEERERLDARLQAERTAAEQRLSEERRRLEQQLAVAQTRYEQAIVAKPAGGRGLAVALTVIGLVVGAALGAMAVLARGHAEVVKPPVVSETPPAAIFPVKPPVVETPPIPVPTPTPAPAPIVAPHPDPGESKAHEAPKPTEGVQPAEAPKPATP